MRSTQSGAATLALIAALLGLAAVAHAAPTGSEPSETGTAFEAGAQILVTFDQRSSRRLPAAGSTPRGYGGGRASYETSPRSARMAQKLAREYGLRHVDGWPIELLDVHCVVYEILDDRPTSEVLERLTADPRVASAQRMQLFEVLGRESYNDPHFPLQHGLHAMQVAAAHQWASGDGVRVAVVDTGVDVDHPELVGRVAAAENFVDRDPLGFTQDVHGTAVAGVIASLADNGIGIVGVAPSVRLLALKACWEGGAGSTGAVCSTFTLAKAISFAVGKRADVLNLSLTGPRDPLLSQLLSRAIDRGVIVVTAMAEGVEDEPGFPASLDRVIAVRASRERISNGRLEPKATLSAPGEDVLTLRPHGAYDFMSGSSLAAAHVSGIAALLLERRPKLSYDAVHRLLDSTSNPAQAEAGGVNACAALAELTGGAGCPARSLSTGQLTPTS